MCSSDLDAVALVGHDQRSAVAVGSLPVVERPHKIDFFRILRSDAQSSQRKAQKSCVKLFHQDKDLNRVEINKYVVNIRVNRAANLRIS